MWRSGDPTCLPAPQSLLSPAQLLLWALDGSFLLFVPFTNWSMATEWWIYPAVGRIQPEVLAGWDYPVLSVRWRGGAGATPSLGTGDKAGAVCAQVAWVTPTTGLRVGALAVTDLPLCHLRPQPCSPLGPSLQSCFPTEGEHGESKSGMKPNRSPGIKCN